MFMMKLEWKAFNIDLRAFDAALRTGYAAYLGNQAHSVLELWFNEEPSQQVKDDIQAMWDAIEDESHAMAQSYQSQEQLKADADAKKASARAKLEALGLTEAELKALLG